MPCGPCLRTASEPASARPRDQDGQGGQRGPGIRTNPVSDLVPARRLPSSATHSPRGQADPRTPSQTPPPENSPPQSELPPQSPTPCDPERGQEELRPQNPSQTRRPRTHHPRTPEPTAYRPRAQSPAAKHAGGQAEPRPQSPSQTPPPQNPPPHSLAPKKTEALRPRAAEVRQNAWGAVRARRLVFIASCCGGEGGGGWVGGWGGVGGVEIGRAHV